VPNAASAVNAANATTAAQAANADTLDGADSADFATGALSFSAQNFHSEAIQAQFSDVVTIPGLGALQARCSDLNPSRTRYRIRNDSPVTLEQEVRSGEVIHLADAQSPLPPDVANEDTFAPGAFSDEVEMLDSGNSRTRLDWHVFNSHEEISPFRYARFEILASGDSNDCFTVILTMASR